MKLLIAGAGGHGRVVADAAESSARWSGIAFIDDVFGESVESGSPWQLIGDLSCLEQLNCDYGSFIAAVGDSGLRMELLDRAVRAGFDIPTIIHPSATVSQYATVAPGTVVLSGAVINFGASLERGCIVNTGATVDHDCVLEDGVHVCPGAHLAGEVCLGAHCWFGLGAVARQGIRIGRGSIVGAGAVCIRDVPAGAIVFGVPATERQA